MRFLWAIMLVLLTMPCNAKRLVEKLPSFSRYYEGYVSVNDVRQRLSTTAMHPIEGVWQFPSTATVVAIEKDSELSRGDLAVRYRMVVVRCDERTLRPGTLMGIIAPTSKKNIYAAEIYTGSDGGSRLHSPRAFTLTLTDDARLSFAQNSKFKIYTNLYRIIPYLSRISFRVYKQQNAPNDLDGCLRIFRMPASGPINPIYL
ncbi:MAG: hypothetical protein NC343_07880 [Muribaculum sp.]|nr:hypothetical protein [Muribaculaceae bacterium]MCM1081655.1 hypothetical protein [Muribaculum sp.]